MATVERTLRPAAVARRRLDLVGTGFRVLLAVSLLVSLGLLTVLLVDVFSSGMGTLTERGSDFLTSNLSRRPARAGVWQGIKGSLMLAAIVAVVAFPLGVATAIYLEEYARPGRLTRFIDLNIRNLAGVPSIVYGILGFGIFVRTLGGITGGRSVVSGGLTLAVLVLPIVIITSAEALRAVPDSLRHAGFGVGATRWEVVRSLVLPSAAPGILTGTILALARALGETAPLILVGAFFGTYFSTPSASLLEQLRGDYTALPMIVFQWATDSQAELKNQLAPAAILVLLAITVSANLVAVLLRNRYERRTR